MTALSMTTFLWFDTEALEAAEFYVNLFPQSKMGNISYYEVDAQRPAGSVLTVEFEIFGQPFAGLNGGPQFPHTEAVSFQVSCETQEDVDRYWNALVDNGGAERMCGWCKDRWGVSWQIIPTALSSALQGKDGYDSKYATEAMLKMSKIVIADLSHVGFPQ
jgi:predicted 3-demethylubiquinone-9 3-methyltransferase (glyoxalase superfamily)